MNGSHLDFVLRTHHETTVQGYRRWSRSKAPLWGLGPGGDSRRGSKGKCQHDERCWAGSRRNAQPGHPENQPPSHRVTRNITLQLSTMPVSVFVIWYFNELGNLFPCCTIILMLVVLILLPTYNRILVIKLSWTDDALTTITEEK